VLEAMPGEYSVKKIGRPHRVAITPLPPSTGENSLMIPALLGDSIHGFYKSYLTLPLLILQLYLDEFEKGGERFIDTITIGLEGTL
jgi:hypothetical protein